MCNLFLVLNYLHQDMQFNIFWRHDFDSFGCLTDVDGVTLLSDGPLAARGLAHWTFLKSVPKTVVINFFVLGRASPILFKNFWSGVADLPVDLISFSLVLSGL
jgi:hypothetical protein